MRTLAPIPTPENVLGLLEAAVKEGRMFEYRIKPTMRKHMAVDLYSVSLLVKVIKALNEKNKAKILAMAPDVGRMAMIAWDCVSNTKKGN